MTREITQANEVDVSVYGDFTVGELGVIRQTIAKDLNDQQFALFMRTSAGWGLNPFLGHIHAMSYGGKLSIQVAVEGYEYKAEENYRDEYLGCEVQLVHEKDEFEAERMLVGDVEFVKVTKHKFGFPRGKVVGGYAVARRKGFPDFTVIMERDEVKDLESKDMWKKWFNDMFKKHIKKRALKGQFRLSINEDEPLEPNVIDVTPGYQAANRPVEIASNGPMIEQRSNLNVIQTDEDTIVDAGDLLKQKQTEAWSKAQQCGMTWDQFGEFCFDKIGDAPDNLNAPKLVAVIKLLDAELEQIAQASAAAARASLFTSNSDDLPF